MKNILIEQAKHPLSVVLRELRWGRPAEAQKFLTRLADKLEDKPIVQKIRRVKRRGVSRG